MKLAKALKLKNKLAGDLSRLQDHIKSCNVVEGKNERPFDVKALYAEYLKKQQELVELKSKISKANILVASNIFKISELKSRIQFLKSLQQDVKEGLVKEVVGFRDAEIERTYTAVLSKKQLEGDILEAESEIEYLQETLDQFNFNSEI